MTKLLVFLICVLTMSATTFSQKNNIEPIENIYIENLYKINDSIYRSAQPNKKAMKYLQQIGVKTILNLRHRRNDKNETKHTQLILENVPINTWEISENNIIDALKIIKNAQKPILIHCLHGSDRTGLIIATYRIVFENYTKEQAITEMLQKQYGFHQKYFNNIIVLINKLNIQNLKTEILNSKTTQ